MPGCSFSVRGLPSARVPRFGSNDWASRRHRYWHAQSAEGEALAVPRTVQRAGILTDLPGFTDLREVGRGGMGVVYRGSRP